MNYTCHPFSCRMKTFIPLDPIRKKQTLQHTARYFLPLFSLLSVIHARLTARNRYSLLIHRTDVIHAQIQTA